MTTEALRPPRHTDFTTDDPDEAHEFLRQTYTDRRMRLRGPRDDFRMTHAQISSDVVAVGTIAHTMAVEHFCEPPGGLLIGRLLEGRLERTTRGETTRYGPGDLFVVSRPDEAYDIRWDTVRAQTARLDLGMLGEVAAEDGDEPAAVRFTGLDTVSPVEARHWRVTVDYVMSSLMTPANLPASPLVVGSAARLLAAATLSTFPNTSLPSMTSAGRLPGARRPNATPAMLRRVIGAMEERADEDVSLFDLAGAARVTPAELVAAFRQHLSTTPVAYLRQIRLDRVNEQLLYPDPHHEVSVPAVAARWGFTDLAAFTASYRAAYGRTPEETLRAAPRRTRGRWSPSRPG